MEERTYGQSAVRFAATVLARGREVLPEERVVEVTAAVEVDEGRLRGSLGVVTIGLSLGNRLESRVEAVDICLVVLGVVQLHNLARDVGLEGAIVVLQVRQRGLAAHKACTGEGSHRRSPGAQGGAESGRAAE